MPNYQKNMRLTGNLRIDLSEFQKLSIEVGYMNKTANILHRDEDGYEYYDDIAVETYEELREMQLDLFDQLIEKYSQM